MSAPNRTQPSSGPVVIALRDMRTPLAVSAADIIEELHKRSNANADHARLANANLRDVQNANASLKARIQELKSVVDWVDRWVSNPVGAYSVYALDGLFRMTREKIAALQPKDSAK